MAEPRPADRAPGRERRRPRRPSRPSSGAAAPEPRCSSRTSCRCSERRSTPSDRCRSARRPCLCALLLGGRRALGRGASGRARVDAAGARQLHARGSRRRSASRSSRAGRRATGRRRRRGRPCPAAPRWRSCWRSACARRRRPHLARAVSSALLRCATCWPRSAASLALGLQGEQPEGADGPGRRSRRQDDAVARVTCDPPLERLLAWLGAARPARRRGTGSLSRTSPASWERRRTTTSSELRASGRRPGGSRRSSRRAARGGARAGGVLGLLGGGQR